MEVDYSKFKSYEEFLAFAKELDTDEQKIVLLCDYFINNVSYNYAYLEAIRINKESTGIEEMTHQIDLKYNAYNEQERNEALLELEQKLGEDMQKRYKDENVSAEELKKVIKAVSELYGTIIPKQEAREVTMFGKTQVINAQPERAVGLVESIKELSGSKSFLLNHAVIENGLIKQAVCAEYAPYIKKYCDDLNIPCAKVDGVGNVDHVWNVVNIDGEIKHIDLTNAIFIRDGYGSNPTNAEYQDWYMASTKEIFEMQPARMIYNIGDKTAMEPITINNYNDYMDFINTSLDDSLQLDTDYKDEENENDL